MADLQTQVVDPSLISSADVDVAAKVDQFKKQLSDTRAIRVQIVEKMRGLVTQVKSLSLGRDQLISLFHTEALNMYPQLVVQDTWAFAQTKDAPYNLFALWQQFNAKYMTYQSQIKFFVDQYNVLQEQDNKLASDEQQTLAMYDSMALPGAPSSSQLVQELQVIDAIPQVEEGSVIAKASALEELNPDAADMVTLQAVQMETNYDPTLVRSSLEESMAPAVTQSAIDAGLIQAPGSDLIGWAKENWKGLLVGGAVAYLLFGGRRS